MERKIGMHKIVVECCEIIEYEVRHTPIKVHIQYGQVIHTINGIAS